MTWLSLPFTLGVFSLQVLASCCLPQQIFHTSLHSIPDEPKNSLELPNPKRNIRICSNKLMNNTSDEINLQSKQDIICSRSESETCNVSTLSGWHNTFFSVRNIPFKSNALIKEEKCILQWDSKDTIITRTSTFTFLVCKQSLLNLSRCEMYDYVMLLIWKLAFPWTIQNKTSITLSITLLINSFLP